MLCSQKLPKILKKEDHPGGLSGRWTGGRRAQTRQMMDREAFATFWSRGQELRKGLLSPQDLSLLFKRFVMQQNFDPVCVLRIIPHYYWDTRWGWEKEVSILNLDSNSWEKRDLYMWTTLTFVRAYFFFINSKEVWPISYQKGTVWAWNEDISVLFLICSPTGSRCSEWSPWQRPPTGLWVLPRELGLACVGVSSSLNQAMNLLEFFFFSFGHTCVACGILVLWPGIKLMSPSV